MIGFAFPLDTTEDEAFMVTDNTIGSEAASSDATPSHQIQSQPAFVVVGMACRASNDRPETVRTFWQRLLAEGGWDRIPNKADSRIISLYTDFETDHTGDYTLLIGARVTDAETVPEDMVAIQVPPARYAVFTSVGPMPDALLATWQRVWDSNLVRAYTTDFDVYPEPPATAERDGVLSFVALAAQG